MDLHHCIHMASCTTTTAPGDTGRDSDGMAVRVGETIPVVCLTHLHLHQLSLTRVGILVSQESPQEVRVKNKIKKDLTIKMKWDIKG